MAERAPHANHRFCTSYDVGQELTDLLGIANLRDVSIDFPLNGLVTAKAEFLIDQKIARSIIALCRDGKWRTPSAEDTGTSDA